MNTSHSPVSWSLFILLLVVGRGIAGPWEPLFNGQDLAGWKEVNGTAPFSVADGMIVSATAAGSPNSFLATEKKFRDFIFECEVKQDGGPGNSGVMFRGLSTPDYMKGRVHGYQMEIDPSSRAWSGGIYDEARRGWLFPGDLNPAAQKAFVYGQWNKLRIEAIGSSLRTWINGVPVAHVIDDMTSAGFIALQVHGIGKNAPEAGHRILWRNLRIQTTGLQPSPPDRVFIRNLIPNALASDETKQGWRLLWDGRTTKGWHSVKAREFPAKGWTIENGELTTLGIKAGSIETDEAFSAFELQLDFKVSTVGNSGVKYFVSGDGRSEPVGLEYQLLDDERHPDAKLGLNGDRTTASLYDLMPRGRLPAGAGIAPKAGEWHHARIIVTPAGHVEHWLNGIKVLEYERGSPEFAAAVARSKFAKIPGFGLGAAGPVLLQDHDSVVHFRSIKLRTLPAP